MTSGAVVAVDPLTATLPVAPGRVHSGVAPLSGSAIGQGLAGAAVSETDEDTLSTLPADDVSLLDPHAVSMMASEAAQAARATGAEMRDEFTIRHATAVVVAVPHRLRIRHANAADSRSLTLSVSRSTR